jgi:RNA polymerase sigma-70 factor (ECF subfamily)
MINDLTSPCAEEAELLASIGAHRNIDALAKLFDHYAGRFLASLRRRGFSQSDADDIVQECFLKIMNAGSLLTTVSAPRAYMWRILLNAASDYIDKKRELVPLDPYIVDGPPSRCVPDAFIAQTTVESDLDTHHCLNAAWDRMLAEAPDRAQALEWVLVEDFSGQEIAQLLNRSYGATREYLSQCRQHFRNILREVCPDWTE